MGKIIKVYLEFSFRCNLKCKFCYAGEIQEKENIFFNAFEFKNFSNIKKKLNLIFCDKSYIYDIDILGGESLLNVEISNILQYIKENYKIRKINLTTNGVLLTKEKILLLLEVGVTDFRVSLHGLEKKHNYLVGKNVFRRVIESLKLLDEIKCNLTIIYVYNNFNKTDLLNLLVFLKKNNINFNKLFIEFVEFSGFGLKNLEKLNILYDNNLKVFFNKQLEYSLKLFNNINIAISNLPKCMLYEIYHKFIDDNFNSNQNFELYIPRLVRKTFQGFSKNELKYVVKKNLEKGYKKSFQTKIEKKYIPIKCFKCKYKNSCYLLIRETILYDYLGLEIHNRKHYFELNKIIVGIE